jgi:hypothetical protein
LLAASRNCLPRKRADSPEYMEQQEQRHKLGEGKPLAVLPFTLSFAPDVCRPFACRRLRVARNENSEGHGFRVHHAFLGAIADYLPQRRRGAEKWAGYKAYHKKS